MQQQHSDAEKVNILVVDDVPDKLISMQVILQDLGENVITVTSGRDALRQLLDRDFAVILLDVNMPDMDGFETATLIRQRKRTEHTPIIFITAFSDDTHALQGYSLGAVDYILAPFVPDVLRTKVAVFVDLFRKGRQIERQAEERVALANEQAARAAAEETTRRSMFLAEASEKLSMSFDYDSTIDTSLRLAGRLGEWATLAITQSYDPDATVKIAARASGSHSDERCVTWQQLPQPLRAAMDATLKSRRAHTINIAPNPSEPSWAEALFVPSLVRSVTLIPLIARGRILGVLGLSRAGEQRLTSSELSIAEDLAARAAIAIDNARLYREIQDGDRRKDEFLAMLGHELRNPLAAISNALECLRLGDEDDSEAAQDVLHRQVNQMTRLVDDLLDVSRITRGKVELRKELVELQAALTRAMATANPAISSRRHELQMQLPDRPIRLYADPVRLEQIFANLLNNAAKYTEPGGCISLTCSATESEVVIGVRDTGMGIAPQLLPKIFDLFIQGDRSLDRSQGGLGIGLTLVKRLIDMHGGQIEALSDGIGRGSQFVVRLPLVQNEVEPSCAADTGSEALRPQTIGRRVLLVDDNPDLTATMAAVLSKMGHDVRTSCDGTSAIDMASEFQPELILVDIGLPGMNGYEVAQYLRGRLRMDHVTLVAMTGYGQEQDRQRSKEAGFDGHLVKPVPIRAIQELLADSTPRHKREVACSAKATG